MRFLHTSDWQIGMKGSGLGEAATLVAAQRIETLERIFRVAREHGVRVVLASGDLFERNELDVETVRAVAAVIGRNPEVAVHAIPGNHDLAGPGSVWNREALRSLGNLHLHRSSEPVLLEGMVLHPFPVKSRRSGRDPLAAQLPLADDGDVHVAMAHGHLTSVTFGGHEEDVRLPIDPQHVERLGLDYLALGHWHGTRILRTSDGRQRMAYSGTHEQTSYRESEAGNVLLVSIEEQGAEPDIAPIRVGAFRWACAAFEFAGDERLDRFREALAGEKADFLELEVAGELPAALYGEWGETVEALRRERRHLRLDDRLRWRHGEAPPLETSDPGLAKVVERIRSAASAGAGREQQELQEALVLLGRLVREETQA